MGTRSNIIIQRPGKQEFASIYCHWDGYLSHNGKILLEHYTTYDKVVELIQCGQLSELCSSPGLCKTTGDRKSIQLSTHLSDLCQEGYCYLFRDGVWWYMKPNVTDFRLLTARDCLP